MALVMDRGFRLATIPADLVAAGDHVLVDGLVERVYVVRCDPQRGTVRIRFRRFMRHYRSTDILEVV